MNIVLIGAGGFLGKHLLKSFLTGTQNIELTVFSSSLRSNSKALSYAVEYYRWPENSLSDTSYKDLFCRSDVIIYAAGAGVQPKAEADERSIYALNLYEPARLVNLLICSGFSGQLITFGSYFESGVTQSRYPLDEKKFLQQCNPLPDTYCHAKKQLTILHHICENIPKQCKWLHLVLTNIYGPGENENRLIPYIISQSKLGMPLHFTEGKQVRQYTFIGDVVSIIHSLLSKASGIYHVSHQETVAVKDIILETVKQAEENFKTKQALHFDLPGRRDAEMNYLAVSPEKLSREWNLACTTGFHQGISSYFGK